jgi:chromosomal replication initiation ATPase DnaA
MTRPAKAREPDPHSRVDDERVFAEVLEQIGTTREVVRARCRQAEAVAARRAVVRRLHARALSFPRIGRLIERDHATCVHLYWKTGHRRVAP